MLRDVSTVVASLRDLDAKYIDPKTGLYYSQHRFLLAILAKDISQFTPDICSNRTDTAPKSL